MNIRNIALIGLFVGMLAACASPIQPDVALPTATQPESTRPAIANPASQNCLEQGGTLSFEELGDGGQFGVCYFEDNRQCEEWALMRGDCPAVGLKVTGFITSAAPRSQSRPPGPPWHRAAGAAPAARRSCRGCGLS